jgi:mannose-6-phosphate isomerase-like protein (cupin superfamily)
VSEPVDCVVPPQRTAAAPDGSDVRVLLALAHGSMAQFSLAPSQCSVPVRHRTVEEIWYVVSGEGEMFRSIDGNDMVTPLRRDVCLTIPVGTRFQFRSGASSDLVIVGVTMPPWPGDGEAILARGMWRPTVAAGPGLVDDDDLAHELGVALP